MECPECYRELEPLDGLQDRQFQECSSKLKYRFTKLAMTTSNIHERAT